MKRNNRRKKNPHNFDPTKEHKVYNPTEKQIAEGCRKAQETWSENVQMQRLRIDWRPKVPEAPSNVSPLY